MFQACDAKGKLVNVLTGRVDRRSSYTCPACRQPVRLKQGKLMRSHFAHVRLADCQFFQENESAEHLDLKATIYRNLLSAGVPVQIEAVLPELGQVADVLVDNRLVLEVQCSRLSSDRLLERTLAYRQAGYQVIWLLGKKLWLGSYLANNQKGFLNWSANMGFHLWELDGDRQVIRLHYLLHEDLRGRVHGLIREQSLASPLLALLRQPYAAQPLSTLTLRVETDPIAYIQRQLCHKNGRWLARQAAAYEAGGNLLAQTAADFYPQVRPIGGDLPQIEGDLLTYYRQFEAFYKNQGVKSCQTVYSPRFYDIIEKKSQGGCYGC